MSASTNAIADSKSLYSAGPNSASQVLANRAAGPIQDWIGNSQLGVIKFEETSNLLNSVKSVTDASDPNLTNINAAIAALNGTSSPTGTIITALKAVYATPPTAASNILANRAAGPIQDAPGNIYACVIKMEECSNLYTSLNTVTDSSDSSNKTLIANLLTLLS